MADHLVLEMTVAVVEILVATTAHGCKIDWIAGAMAYQPEPMLSNSYLYSWQ